MEASTGDRPRKLPLDYWKKYSVVDWLQKRFRWHVVSLQIRGRSPSDTATQFASYSGFLLMHRDNLLWVTAGHVVDELQDVMNPDNFTIHGMKWMDNYEQEGPTSAPAWYRNPPMNSWSSTGIDIGVVKIQLLDRESLLANQKLDILPIPNLAIENPQPPDGCYLVGFPKQLHEYTKTQIDERMTQHKFVVSLTCLPFELIDQPEYDGENELWKDPTALYGRLLPFADRDEVPAVDVKGMSGGPILGIKYDGENVGYGLMGVQSSWLPDRKILRAEPIKRLIQLLDTWL